MPHRIGLRCLRAVWMAPGDCGVGGGEEVGERGEEFVEGGLLREAWRSRGR